MLNSKNTCLFDLNKKLRKIVMTSTNSDDAYILCMCMCICMGLCECISDIYCRHYYTQWSK